jgi:hypothetical protein
MSGHRFGHIKLKPSSQLVDSCELVHEPNHGTPVANTRPVYRVAVKGVRAERSTLFIATQAGGYPVQVNPNSLPLRHAHPHQVVHVASDRLCRNRPELSTQRVPDIRDCAHPVDEVHKLEGHISEQGVFTR